MGPTPNISVIICVYTEERWDDIVAAVESLRGQVLLPLETIVVVDHNPALLERARMNLHDVVVVENRQPRGLSGARNSGIGVAHGDVIAFLDDDAVAEADWLARLASWCSDPRVMGVGGFVEPMWESRRPNWFPAEFDWVFGCSYRGLPLQQAEVRNPYGGCAAIKREVFETVGGFRDGIGRVGALPVGGEETELSIRARQRWPERTFIYEPTARIHHKVPDKRLRWNYFYSRCYAEGISKALISRLRGARDGLTSERAYVMHVLPRGVLRGVADAVTGREPGGLARAWAIISGLAVTTAGYVRGSLHDRPALPQPVGSPRGAVK